MGGAIKRSLINAYFLLSAYFLSTPSYKCMRLTTRVYGTLNILLHAPNHITEIGLTRVPGLLSVCVSVPCTKLHMVYLNLEHLL